MRILVSGLTGAHSGRVRRGVVGRMNPVEFVVRALRDAGHEVDWTGYKLQDELTGYDLLWFVLSPPKSTSAMNYGLGGLSLLGRWRGRYVLQIDDWNLRHIFNDTRSLLRAPGETLYRVIDKETGELFFRGEQAETVRRYEAYVTEGLRRMIGANTGAVGGIVTLAYGWGDLTRLVGELPLGLRRVRLVRIDPSPAVYEIIRDQSVVTKERRWVMAALAKHETWLRRRVDSARWPVTILGADGKKTDEAGVYVAYRESWGALSPPYPHAGSGWWRTRFIYAAAAGTVLVCENSEADALGSCYRLSMQDIERLDDTGLREVSEGQRNALRPWMVSWNEFVGQCDLAAQV
jgi:hypothetical protein